MSQIDIIRAEIESKRDQNREGENSYYDVNDIKNAGICRHKRILCEHFLSFLDTLEEQPVDLEKEIERVLEDSSFRASIDSGGFTTTVLNYQKIARHFAKWGAEHLKK